MKWVQLYSSLNILWHCPSLGLEWKPVHPKGNQPWIVIGRTDAEAEAPILWPPDAKSQLIGKEPDAGKDWRQEDKGETGWDGWMASPTQWTWVWANYGRWWRTGKPGVLQSMGVTNSWRRLSDWRQWHPTPVLMLGKSHGQRSLLGCNPWGG